MITSQIIQNSIDELSAITRVQLSVMDLKGRAVAATADAIKKDEKTWIYLVEKKKLSDEQKDKIQKCFINCFKTFSSS